VNQIGLTVICATPLIVLIDLIRLSVRNARAVEEVRRMIRDFPKERENSLPSPKK